jgi:glycosyltransferase involved in cell wall biosynthesis
MNILYLCDEYPPCQHGGIGTVTQNLARTLVEKGHKVVVAGFYPYYRKATKSENDKGVKVYRFFYGSKFQLQFSKRKFSGRFINIERQFNNYIDCLKKIIQENEIDIIESPDFVEAFRYSGPRMIQFPDFGIPFLIKLHGSYTYFNFIENKRSKFSKLFKKEKLLLDNASGVIAISNFVKTEITSLFNYNKRVHLIYNGIDSNLSTTYNANQTCNTVVFVGSLEEKKGVFSLIKAWKEIVSTISSARLLIYGRGSNKTIKLLNDLIIMMAIKTIELKGFVLKEDLPGIYASASCAIFPSYAETFGMAPIEAMAVGCPTIFTKRTSGPEIIDHGVDGLLVDPDNIQEIASAVISMLANRNQAIEMGKKGVKKVRDNFDIKLIAEKHIDYYNGLIGQNQS